MSIPLYTSQQIHDFTINNSSSKQQYSFSKSERFPKIKPTTDSLYILPSTKTTRKAGFGYGTRSDFTNSIQRKGMNPGYYSILRDYDDYPTHIRGHYFKFGPGRSETRINGEAYNKKVPGPGNYGIAPRFKFGNGGPSFQLKGKLSYDYSIKRHKGMPGPGVYSSVININKDGKYAPSNIRNMTVYSFGSPNEDRFKFYDNKVPGPCYTMPSTLGRQFNSLYINDRYTKIGERYKYPGNKDNYPGPGSYMPFSEFGVLISKNAVRGRGKKRKEKEKNKDEEDNKDNEEDKEKKEEKKKEKREKKERKEKKEKKEKKDSEEKKDGEEIKDGEEKNKENENNDGKEEDNYEVVNENKEEDKVAEGA